MGRVQVDIGFGDWCQKEKQKEANNLEGPLVFTEAKQHKPLQA